MRSIPAQPSYARPVELILPSIGFGLLYLHYGLLPGIVLHYAFDVVLFAIPILLADAPGIWVQKAMIALFVLVPLWVVLVRRAQVGRWTELSPADRNAAWTPPVTRRTRYRRLRTAADGHRTTRPHGMAGDRGGRAGGDRRRQA